MKSIIGLLSKAKRKLSSFAFWRRGKLPEAIRYAVLTACFFQALDLLSTLIVLRADVGAHEGNPFMVDTVGNFLIWKALKIKTLFMGGYGILTYGLYDGTGNDKLASIPFYWMAYTLMIVSMNNFVILLGHN